MVLDYVQLKHRLVLRRKQAHFSLQVVKRFGSLDKMVQEVVELPLVERIHSADDDLVWTNWKADAELSYILLIRKVHSARSHSQLLYHHLLVHVVNFDAVVLVVVEIEAGELCNLGAAAPWHHLNLGVGDEEADLSLERLSH